MEFFNEKRNYILCFLFFSLWSFYKNSKYTILFQVYSVLLTASVIGSFVYGVYLDHFHEHATLTVSVRICLFVIMLLAYLIVAIESLYKSKAQKELIQRFSIVDHSFNNKLGIGIPYKRERRESFVRISFFVSIILIVNIYNTIESNYTVFTVYSLTCSIWVVCLRSVQVMFFVYLTQKRLILINEELVYIRNVVNSQFKYVNQRQGSGPSTDSAAKKNFVYNRILNTKLIYEQLYDIYEMLTHMFGFSLLAIFIQSFFSLTSNGYWVFLALDDTSFDLKTFIQCTNVIIQTLVPISALAFYGSSCYKTVRLIFFKDCLE